MMTQYEFNNNILELKPNLQRFAMSLTNNNDDAFDLLQDTYYKAILYKDKFVDNTNLKSWIFTIMKNTFINNYRKNLSQNTIFNKIGDLYYINQINDNGHYSPESTYGENEISKAIESLNIAIRVPFKMHVEGYKYKEIAKKLKINIGTVKSRIFLARKNLMMGLKDYR